MTPRDAFPGYDDPVNIDMEPEDALKVLVLDESDNDEDDEAAEDEPNEYEEKTE